MSQPTLIIHVVPIQVTLTGTTATITCNDPRAALVDDELVFTLNPLDPNDGEAQPRVCFVVEDLPDDRGYDNYFTMSSAPPLEKLVAWKRTAEVSRSPEMLPGHSFEVVAVAYSVPSSQPAAPVKLGHGRRRIKIYLTGAPGTVRY
ncbi:MAG TPA: hypothetical protein VGB85_25590 [Nannocystis sp.]|jgi:hypothetical protein